MNSKRKFSEKRMEQMMNVRLSTRWGASALVIVLLFGVSLNTVAAKGQPSEWLGPKPPGAAYPEGEEDRQFAILSHDLKQRARFEQFAPQTLRKESLILDTDRDPLDVVLRRSRSLLTDLTQTTKDDTDLAAMAEELATLQAAADKVEVADQPGRRTIFDQVCHLRRRIAFSNPLLKFNELLILKRHLAIYRHMCDQYYGMAQRPGGGLFVLSDPFGAKPEIRDLLADSTVADGRLEGERLSGGPKRSWNISFDGMGNQRGEATEGGSFLSPDVSFDAKRIAFAYVEGRGDPTHRHHTDPSKGHWDPGRCYHVFSMSADGSDLRMLADGTFNDFDPCFMPSGRIAFISERRGGYLRCGRVCPTFTLFDMAANGSDIRCLSYHETNEWHPSVADDGMIVWTRWDYVDRHGQTVHLPWTTTPDGRDPRAIHGNFAIRSKRPDMEVDIRAIPNSPRFVATAAPHHNQAFGSLVVFDPTTEDDDEMSPVKRVTPDVGFPESQKGSLSYGQAWPLSEDYYLCVYAPLEVGSIKDRNIYGVYLVDAFGNKELIYRDPDIACHNPIPLTPRPTPPIVLEQSRRVAADEPAEGTIAVMNVYDTLKPWPDNTRIKALRVYQVLPLSIPSASVKHATGMQIPQAKDSINLARAVLGTVPVEEDGSVYFVAPARKELYFQVLDEEGLAVTSMRSGTHLQPGERLVCQGCHEPRHRAPKSNVATMPSAMRRPPSRLEPDVDGTYPFSYPRLVQPVLDRHCVECHAEKADEAPPLDSRIVKTARGSYMNPVTEYYISYLSLAPEFGFYDYGGTNFNDPKWYRTTPGEFGARASKLYALLRKGHYEVKLPPEDMHRLTVWLDSCSLFYGVYEKEGGQAQLRGEIARPTLE
ncbi:MAG: hypothetical protein V3R99_07760 [Thermoguttaceae bacterium]